MSEDRTPEQSGLRPAGKRQVMGSATSSERTSAPRSDEEKLGGGITQYIPEVVSEMRKVIWPTASQMVVYTFVVIVFLVLMTALVSGVDFLAAQGIDKLFN